MRLRGRSRFRTFNPGRTSGYQRQPGRRKNRGNLAVCSGGTVTATVSAWIRQTIIFWLYASRCKWTVPQFYRRQPVCISTAAAITPSPRVLECKLDAPFSMKLKFLHMHRVQPKRLWSSTKLSWPMFAARVCKRSGVANKGKPTRTRVNVRTWRLKCQTWEMCKSFVDQREAQN